MNDHDNFRKLATGRRCQPSKEGCPYRGQFPVHGEMEGLKSVSLEFLPANATAAIQLKDQGVIQNIKVIYRRPLVNRMLLCADAGKSYSTDLLLAIHILAHAWEQVHETTIQRCFHHAGFQAQVILEAETLADADVNAGATFSQVLPLTLLRQDYEAIEENLSACCEDSLEELIEAQADDQTSFSDDSEDITPSAVMPDSAAKEAVEHSCSAILSAMGVQNL